MTKKELQAQIDKLSGRLLCLENEVAARRSRIDKDLNEFRRYCFIALEKAEVSRNQIQQLRDEVAQEFAKRDNFSAMTPEMTPEPVLFNPEPALFNAEVSEMPQTPVREKPVKREWISGVEAMKMLGWSTNSTERLLKARITFRQASKGKPLSVSVRSIEDYLRRRKTRKSAAKQKEC